MALIKVQLFNTNSTASFTVDSVTTRNVTGDNLIPSSAIIDSDQLE
jgi:hypothetical protein